MLNSLLATSAENAPQDPFLVDISRQWSYAEAARDVGGLAATLQAYGVRPGDRVGIHLHKCGESTLAMHAAVWLGAVAVPLDPAAPIPRLADICARMSLRVVLTHQPRATGVRELIGVADSPIEVVIGVAIDEVPNNVTTVSWDQACSEDPISPAAVGGADRAYIITTSGSTGTPKGIVHTHASAMAYAKHTMASYDVTARDRVTDIAPNHFDISTCALWTVPLAGASNLVLPEPYQRMPASLSQVISDKAATIWYSVPFLLQQLVTRGDLENRDLSHLRWVKFGGEMMARETLLALQKHAPDATFSNVFGPAETNQCTIANFTTIPNPDDGVLPVGRPVGGAKLRIVDPDAAAPLTDAESDDGVLWVANPALMEGYFDMAEVNAKVLVDLDGDRWYRTGDRLTRADDGELTFRGRLDNQVKVRGFRIELESIEAELERCETVEHAVVGVMRQSDGDALIAGLFLQYPADSDDKAIAAVQQHAQSALARWSLPARYVTLSEKYFTGSGKLDRNRLRMHLVGAVSS